MATSVCLVCGGAYPLGGRDNDRITGHSPYGAGASNNGAMCEGSYRTASPAFNRYGELVAADAYGAMRFGYKWNHFNGHAAGHASDSGSGVTYALFVNREAFEQCIERWNNSQPNTWSYEAL